MPAEVEQQELSGEQMLEDTSAPCGRGNSSALICTHTQKGVKVVSVTTNNAKQKQIEHIVQLRPRW